MGKESQHSEWKESWRDECLKWICAFANTVGGGKLHIGVNDNGEIVGVSNAKKLLEDLPNKIRDLLGLVPSVELKEKDGKDYLVIEVDYYPFPVSIRGKYYIRSGSTLQELKGAALDKFILSKQGKRWDGVPVPDVRVDELSEATFDSFKAMAAKSNRVDEEVLEDSHKAILDNLHLLDGTYIKRAGVLLFHKNPEKFFTGCTVKIGFFRDDDDLVYQDEVNGNLIQQAEEVLDILKKKYFRAEIDYSEDGVRLESFVWSERAVREAVYNAIAHKDYAKSNPTQISVYEDKVIFWNEGELPEGLTFEDLKTKHPSKPQNPDIANTLFRAGIIEAWGRGTIKMRKACKKAGLPEPIIDNRNDGMYVEFRRFTKKSLEALDVKAEFISIILYVQQHGSINNKKVQELCGVSKATATRYLGELEGEYLEKQGTTGTGTEYTLR